jgi:quercetin dioxygenase-like cupin family protein
VYQLAPGLLLVFKPRGHQEAPHVHPHPQRLHVLRGALVVQIGKRRVTLTPTSRRLTVRAGRAHETLALQDTWVVAESSSINP